MKSLNVGTSKRRNDSFPNEARERRVETFASVFSSPPCVFESKHNSLRPWLPFPAASSTYKGRKFPSSVRWRSNVETREKREGEIYFSGTIDDLSRGSMIFESLQQKLVLWNFNFVSVTSVFCFCDTFNLLFPFPSNLFNASSVSRTEFRPNCISSFLFFSFFSNNEPTCIINCKI